MITRIRVELPFTKQQMDDLVGLAIRYGFMRNEPRRSWTTHERKIAARYAMERAVSNELKAYEERGLSCAP